VIPPAVAVPVIPAVMPILVMITVIVVITTNARDRQQPQRAGQHSELHKAPLTSP
jgi:hypothetical protein